MPKSIVLCLTLARPNYCYNLLTNAILNVKLCEESVEKIDNE